MQMNYMLNMMCMLAKPTTHMKQYTIKYQHNSTTSGTTGITHSSLMNQSTKQTVLGYNRYARSPSHASSHIAQVDQIVYISVRAKPSSAQGYQIRSRFQLRINRPHYPDYALPAAQALSRLCLRSCQITSSDQLRVFSSAQTSKLTTACTRQQHISPEIWSLSSGHPEHFQDDFNLHSQRKFLVPSEMLQKPSNPKQLAPLSTQGYQLTKIPLASTHQLTLLSLTTMHNSKLTLTYHIPAHTSSHFLCLQHSLARFRPRNKKEQPAQPKQIIAQTVTLEESQGMEALADSGAQRYSPPVGIKSTGSSPVPFKPSELQAQHDLSFK
ncbi:hypothetical protein F511_09435 [Dorcoceras hygrometricum]|uniref:Uncharacterized protein n=1 Tax=Dorcoceras hygrometricum TaxID=472368 RepID=A0A2Z7C6W5_9LAMI|nr:hypothetical protein F511_09435 [Dorcoceras hygrometricum]